MPPISQPLISNKCRITWSLNTNVLVCVCVCEQLEMCCCLCRCMCFHPCMYVCVCVIAAKMCTFKWECIYECVCEDMKVARNNLLMGTYPIRDTYTTQPDHNANIDPSSWCFCSKTLLSWKAKWSISRWSVYFSEVFFFHPIVGSSYFYSM